MMWEWLKQADNLKSVGTVAGAVGNIYSAYDTSKTNKALMNQQNELLALQKANYNRGIAKEDLAQSNLDSAIASSFGTKKKKKDTTTASFDLQTA